MMKEYVIEIKVGSKWIAVDSKIRHVDALDVVRKRSGEEIYPLRIVRIQRTVVFEEKK